MFTLKDKKGEYEVKVEQTEDSVLKVTVDGKIVELRVARGGLFVIADAPEGLQWRGYAQAEKGKNGFMNVAAPKSASFKVALVEKEAK